MSEQHQLSEKIAVGGQPTLDDLHRLREQHAAGIALCPALGTPASLTKKVQSWGIPLVVMVRTLGDGSYDFAGSDNAKGVQMATAHLVAAGHRRIGFLGGQSGPVLDQRLQGYKAALAQAGISSEVTANPGKSLDWYLESGDQPEWVGDERWNPIVVEAVKLRQIAAESSVRVLVGDHAVLVSGDEKHVVGVVFIKGHPVVKSVVRMVRQLLRPRQSQASASV